MSKQQALAQACFEQLWQNDQASQHLGIEMQWVDEGRACINMQVQEFMLNGHGTCHGGFLFAMADSAFAFACNSDNRLTVASGCSIDFVRPAKAGDLLTATAQRLSRGKSTGVYDVQITNAKSQTIAHFRGRAHQVGSHIIKPS
jgi:acyl-CoA thioesterase